MEREEERKQNSTQKSNASRKNHEFVVVTYFFLAIFMGMMAYFVYFQLVKSEEFISSSYNKRQDLFAQKVVRGDILSAEGYTLATTVTDKEGNESRSYPYGNMFSHIVGYSTNGKSGIESFENLSLLRSHTFVLEKAANVLRGKKSEGDNVVTTLNFALQETAYRALGNYDGAVIAMEASTGKILCMVSKPDFNPNNIAVEWETLTAEENESSVLVNRATQGLYPPGSTFKILTTLAYIRENPDYESYTYDCEGRFATEDIVIRCANNKIHGTIDLEESFAKSCNSSFASLGLSLDTEAFSKMCGNMLFNETLPTEFASLKSSFSLDKNASKDDIVQTVIGQGKTLVTPLHMLLLVSGIANDGVVMSPYVIDHTENYEGVLVKSFEPKEYKTIMTEKEAGILQEYMQSVVEYGTAEALSGQSYAAAGKTGSAEFSKNSDASHAWFVGYAHQEGKEDIAIAVIVEKSGLGSKYAVPIAKQVFDAYYQE